MMTGPTDARAAHWWAKVGDPHAREQAGVCCDGVARTGGHCQRDESKTEAVLVCTVSRVGVCWHGATERGRDGDIRSARQLAAADIATTEM